MGLQQLGSQPLRFLGYVHALVLMVTQTKREPRHNLPPASDVQHHLPRTNCTAPKITPFLFFFYTALWGYIYPVHIQNNLGTILRLSTLQFFAHSPAWLWLVQISNLLHEVHAYFEGEPMLRVIYKALQFC